MTVSCLRDYSINESEMNKTLLLKLFNSWFSEMLHLRYLYRNVCIVFAIVNSSKNVYVFSVTSNICVHSVYYLVYSSILRF